MYCPNCGTNNLDGARFCRSCGADISLVPQALSGHLPEAQSEVRGRKGRHGGATREEALLDKAIRNCFMGVGFLIVAIILTFVGRGWGFWMFIPAFAMLGGGVAEYMRLKQAQARSLPRALATPAMNAAAVADSAMSAAGEPRVLEPQRLNTAEMVVPPPSVTEGTTRHLGAEAPTRHITRAVDSSSEQEPG